MSVCVCVYVCVCVCVAHPGTSGSSNPDKICARWHHKLSHEPAKTAVHVCVKDSSALCNNCMF